ncbi:MAG: GLPGLI family protein [Psychroserpens sp.]|uniref:GLPGLI family protein n=1 Tax=Psychroserpens sp. TaxID=2020870 RepID=UPI003C710766
MKNLVYFILLLTISSYSQNSGSIEYIYISNFGINYQTIGVLEFNTERSKFTLLKPNDSLKEITTIREDNNLVISSQESNFRPINYVDRNSGNLFTYERMFKKNNLLIETIPSINWQIKEEFKDIGQFKCQQAVGYFRGRTYTVWFANEIPVPYGPWKLQGLPGLILEVNDDKNEIFIKASKIDFKSTLNINLPDTKEATSLQEFITVIIPKKFKKLEAEMNARADRNTTFTIGTFDRNTEKEIIYEWEEN